MIYEDFSFIYEAMLRNGYYLELMGFFTTLDKLNLLGTTDD